MTVPQAAKATIAFTLLDTYGSNPSRPIPLFTRFLGADGKPGEDGISTFTVFASAPSQPPRITLDRRVLPEDFGYKVQLIINPSVDLAPGTVLGDLWQTGTQSGREVFTNLLKSTDIYTSTGIGTPYLKLKKTISFLTTGSTDNPLGQSTGIRPRVPLTPVTLYGYYYEGERYVTFHAQVDPDSSQKWTVLGTLYTTTLYSRAQVPLAQEVYQITSSSSTTLTGLANNSLFQINKLTNSDDTSVTASQFNQLTNSKGLWTPVLPVSQEEVRFFADSVQPTEFFLMNSNGSSVTPVPPPSGWGLRKFSSVDEFLTTYPFKIDLKLSTIATILAESSTGLNVHSSHLNLKTFSEFWETKTETSSITSAIKTYLATNNLFFAPVNPKNVYTIFIRPSYILASTPITPQSPVYMLDSLTTNTVTLTPPESDEPSYEHTFTEYGPVPVGDTDLTTVLNKQTPPLRFSATERLTIYKAQGSTSLTTSRPSEAQTNTAKYDVAVVYWSAAALKKHDVPVSSITWHTFNPKDGASIRFLYSLSGTPPNAYSFSTQPEASSAVFAPLTIEPNDASWAVASANTLIGEFSMSLDEYNSFTPGAGAGVGKGLVNQNALISTLNNLEADVGTGPGSAWQRMPLDGKPGTPGTDGAGSMPLYYLNDSGTTPAVVLSTLPNDVQLSEIRTYLDAGDEDGYSIYLGMVADTYQTISFLSLVSYNTSRIGSNALGPLATLSSDEILKNTDTTHWTRLTLAGQDVKSGQIDSALNDNQASINDISDSISAIVAEANEKALTLFAHGAFIERLSSNLYVVGSSIVEIGDTITTLKGSISAQEVDINATLKSVSITASGLVSLGSTVAALDTRLGEAETKQNTHVFTTQQTLSSHGRQLSLLSETTTDIYNNLSQLSNVNVNLTKSILGVSNGVYSIVDQISVSFSEALSTISGVTVALNAHLQEQLISHGTVLASLSFNLSNISVRTAVLGNLLDTFKGSLSGASSNIATLLDNQNSIFSQLGTNSEERNLESVLRAISIADTMSSISSDYFEFKGTVLTSLSGTESTVDGLISRAGVSLERFEEMIKSICGGHAVATMETLQGGLSSGNWSDLVDSDGSTVLTLDKDGALSVSARESVYEGIKGKIGDEFVDLDAFGTATSSFNLSLTTFASIFDEFRTLSFGSLASQLRLQSISLSGFQSELASKDDYETIKAKLSGENIFFTESEAGERLHQIDVSLVSIISDLGLALTSLGSLADMSGVVGPQGPPGPKGEPGADGAAGADGAPGADATVDQSTILNLLKTGFVLDGTPALGGSAAKFEFKGGETIIKDSAAFPDPTSITLPDNSTLATYIESKTSRSSSSSGGTTLDAVKKALGADTSGAVNTVKFSKTIVYDGNVQFKGGATAGGSEPYDFSGVKTVFASDKLMIGSSDIEAYIGTFTKDLTTVGKVGSHFGFALNSVGGTKLMFANQAVFSNSATFSSTVSFKGATTFTGKATFSSPGDISFASPSPQTLKDYIDTAVAGVNSNNSNQTGYGDSNVKTLLGVGTGIGTGAPLTFNNNVKFAKGIVGQGGEYNFEVVTVKLDPTKVKLKTSTGGDPSYAYFPDFIDTKIQAKGYTTLPEVQQSLGVSPGVAGTMAYSKKTKFNDNVTFKGASSILLGSTSLDTFLSTTYVKRTDQQSSSSSSSSSSPVKGLANDPTFHAIKVNDPTNADLLGEWVDMGKTDLADKTYINVEKDYIIRSAPSKALGSDYNFAVYPDVGSIVGVTALFDTLQLYAKTKTTKTNPGQAGGLICNTVICLPEENLTNARAGSGIVMDTGTFRCKATELFDPTATTHQTFQLKYDSATYNNSYQPIAASTSVKSKTGFTRHSLKVAGEPDDKNSDMYALKLSTIAAVIADYNSTKASAAASTATTAANTAASAASTATTNSTAFQPLLQNDYAAVTATATATATTDNTKVQQPLASFGDVEGSNPNGNLSVAAPAKTMDGSQSATSSQQVAAANGGAKSTGTIYAYAPWITVPNLINTVWQPVGFGTSGLLIHDTDGGHEYHQATPTGISLLFEILGSRNMQIWYEGTGSNQRATETYSGNVLGGGHQWVFYEAVTQALRQTGHVVYHLTKLHYNHVNKTTNATKNMGNRIKTVGSAATSAGTQINSIWTEISTIHTKLKDINLALSNMSTDAGNLSSSLKDVHSQGAVTLERRLAAIEKTMIQHANLLNSFVPNAPQLTKPGIISSDAKVMPTNYDLSDTLKDFLNDAKSLPAGIPVNTPLVQSMMASGQAAVITKDVPSPTGLG